MKKLTSLIFTLAMAGVSTSFAQTLTLSTYKGTDLSAYDGKTMTITLNRYLFHGWNTISLPFPMDESQLNEAFGKDCKLERLVGVENDGLNVKLNFQNCKHEGIQAGKPYILHYSGANGSQVFSTENVLITQDCPPVTFTVEGTGETVTMQGLQSLTPSQGLYGVLSADNDEASFVNVDHAKDGFFATRCSVQLSGGNLTTLLTNHIDDEGVGIATVIQKDERVDVYNLSGVKVATAVNIREVEHLQRGVYVIKGKTIVVE